MPPTDWPYQPGDVVSRSDVHDRFGGSRQSGISPSATEPVVLIFSDPRRGPEHGYYDTWGEDGRFEYTGQGRAGHQTIDDYPNNRIFSHAQDATSIHLFENNGQKGIWRYEGEMVFDRADPFHIDRAPETGGGPMRDVVVFHLLPTSMELRHGNDRLDIVERERVESTAIEAFNTERYLARPNIETEERERSEQQLVTDYAAWVQTETGVELTRFIYHLKGKRLACDAFNANRDLLIEAKSSTDRNSIRLAIGQLIDYSRFHDEPKMAVLLPRDPGFDLTDMIFRIGAGVIHRSGSGFLEEWPS